MDEKISENYTKYHVAKSHIPLLAAISVLTAYKCNVTNSGTTLFEETKKYIYLKSGIRSLWRGNSFGRVVRDEEDKTPDISISSMEDEELGKFFRIKPTIFLVTSSLSAGRQLIV